MIALNFGQDECTAVAIKNSSLNLHKIGIGDNLYLDLFFKFKPQFVIFNCAQVYTCK